MIPGWQCQNKNCPNHKNPWCPNKKQWVKGFIKCPNCNSVEIIKDYDADRYMEIMT